MSSGFGSFVFDPDQTEMLVAEEFYFNEAEGDDLAYYHNTTGIWDKDQAEKMDTDDDAFWQISNAFQDEVKPMPFQPLSDRSAADAGSQTDSAETVST